MLNIDHPWSFDSSGQTRTTDWHDHIKDMLLQYLLTLTGERVNRPDFGTPLYRMCFEGNSQGLADVIQFVSKAGLDRWFGHILDVIELVARAEDAFLIVDIRYRIKGENEVRHANGKVPLPAGATV